MLLDKLSDEELDEFCSDHFPEVYTHEFSGGLIKRKKVSLLLDYCKRRGQMGVLIEEFSNDYPEQFDAYKDIVYQHGPSSYHQTPASVNAQEERQSTAQPDVRSQNLPNDQIVDFVIIAPLKEERDAILRKLPGHQELPPSNQDVYVHYAAALPVTFSNKQTSSYELRIVSPLEKGRVQAVHAATEAIRRWQPRYVLLVGIAGGVAAAGVNLGDVLIASQIADYELQKQTDRGSEIRWQVYPASPAMLAQTQNFSLREWQDLISQKRPGDGTPHQHEGIIASGDKVVAFADILAAFNKTWPELIGVEMEAGGVAVAAEQSASRPGFFMVRSVSDFADSKKGSTAVEKWRPYACDVAAAYAIALLENGPVTTQQPTQPVNVADLLSQIRAKHGQEAFDLLDKLYKQAHARQIETIRPDDFVRLLHWLNQLNSRPIPGSRKNNQNFWLFAVLEKHYLLLEGETMPDYFDDKPTPSLLAYILRQSADQLEGAMMLLAEYHEQWGTKAGYSTLKASQERLDDLQSIINHVLEVVEIYTPLPALLPEDILGSDELENSRLVASIRDLKQTLQRLPAHIAMMRGISGDFKRILEKQYDDLQFFVSCYSDWLFEFAERVDRTFS